MKFHKALYFASLQGMRVVLPSLRFPSLPWPRLSHVPCMGHYQITASPSTCLKYFVFFSYISLEPCLAVYAG